MARATSKRPKTASIPQSAVEQAGTFLQQLPEKPKEHLSLREAVDRMQDQIQTVLARGYSYEEVAQLLSRQGISISSSTLKNYVASGKRQASAEMGVTKPRRRRARQEQPEDTSVPSDITRAEEADLGSEEPVSLNGSAPASTEESEDEAPEPTTRRRGRISNAAKEKAADASSEAPAKRGGGRRPSAAKSTTRTTTRGRKKANA